MYSALVVQHTDEEESALCIVPVTLAVMHGSISRLSADEAARFFQRSLSIKKSSQTRHKRSGQSG
jgi:hypothetical protein